MNNIVYQFIRDVVSTKLVETEYNGTMLHHCFSCGSQDDDHYNDCLVLLGQHIIDTQFQEFEQQRIREQQAQRDMEIRQNQTFTLLYHTKKKIYCIACHDQVNKHDLINHVNSKKCIKKQRNKQLPINQYHFNRPIVQSAPELYTYNKHTAHIGDTIKCPWCKTSFMKRTYQHVFCVVEHKDHYWNNIRKVG